MQMDTLGVVTLDQIRQKYPLQRKVSPNAQQPSESPEAIDILAAEACVASVGKAGHPLG
jgi:hypothetical protein